MFSFQIKVNTHVYLTTIQQESFKNSDPHHIDEFIVLKLAMMIGMWEEREGEKERVKCFVFVLEWGVLVVHVFVIMKQAFLVFI